MNRFKSKKKSPKEELAETRPSLESDSSFSLFRRGKKSQEPEQKVELDLASALPSNDDFRTSLLMNGLSARFSMLREQDDPNSKIGKASDDSVLFPKRQSRMADFGFGSGLGDIAEVESFKAPTFPRKDSNASCDSSMMTRSRPMESNVLFGGRQKIYKVANGKSAGEGMSGRVLYDGDVASSSFQKWRATEKEKEISNLDEPEDHEDDQASSDRGPEETSFITSPESPVQGYNKKRETSSTTSSTPSVGCNSTAATSIMSQPTSAYKDGGQSSTSTSSLERNVTRTRKLYEQGLTQNLQEQQHSVLTRVDTLARRPGGGRTPEMSPNTPSPTTSTFNDRWAAFGNERRTISTKGSAPNLRSTTSPPVTGPLNGKMTLDTSVATDAKGGLFTSPPLSPPISDAGTGEHVNLDIQAKDLGKATAMNVFQKPTSPYDDSKYTERMRQLQQSRGTPIQRFRDDANFTFPDTHAQSPGSHKGECDIKTTTISAPKKAEAPVQQDSLNESKFLDANLESPILNEHVHVPQTPELRLERPSDLDHPALRGVIAPGPLNFSATNEPQSPDPATPDFLSIGRRPDMLADSPTLGPTTGGLSGMVRQHLRTESDVSSIYTQSPQLSPTRYYPTRALEEIDSIESRTFDIERNPTVPKPMPRMEGPLLDTQSRSPDDEAEFADQLADARRRVREKLTSFVETDTVRYPPPVLPDQAPDLPAPTSRSNPLGILKGKGSRGSLADRGRDAARSTRDPGMGDVTEARLNEEEDAHPSLRAFRQARREMQKRKEYEVGISSQRPNMTSPSTGEQMHTTHSGRLEVSSNPSGDRTPHGAASQPRHTTRAIPEGMSSPPPRSRSRPTRDRSGSEHSNESNPSRSRPPPRFRGQVPAHDGQFSPPDMSNGQAPRRPTARSPGLPGSDVRGSPSVPPVNPRSVRRPAAPGLVTGDFNDPANLKSLPGLAMTAPLASGPFPNSPRNGRFEQPRALNPPNSASAPGSASSTPTLQHPGRSLNSSSAYSPTTGSTLTDAMKRSVNKKDISEPTFVMSTSRVPTTNLPQDGCGNRSRNGSFADPGSPPPLPPVNPRRRRDSSKTRTLLSGFMGGRRSDEADTAAFSRSTPQLPLSSPPMPSHASPVDDERPSGYPAADENDDRSSRRRLKKASSELGMDRRANSNPQRVNSPQVAVGLPAGRAGVMKHGPTPNMNGGMF